MRLFPSRPRESSPMGLASRTPSRKTATSFSPRGLELAEAVERARVVERQTGLVVAGPDRQRRREGGRLGGALPGAAEADAGDLLPSRRPRYPRCCMRVGARADPGKAALVPSPGFGMIRRPHASPFPVLLRWPSYSPGRDPGVRQAVPRAALTPDRCGRGAAATRSWLRLRRSAGSWRDSRAVLRSMEFSWERERLEEPLRREHHRLVVEALGITITASPAEARQSRVQSRRGGRASPSAE